MDRYLGIEIGGTKLQIVTADDSLAITHRWRGEVDRSAGAAGIRAQLAAAMENMLENEGAVAVGVGFGGPVDVARGRIACSHQIGGWNDFELREWLWRETGAPAVVVDNDANVAALGEALAGAGKGIATVFYLQMGSGVGGGLVADGTIYHGQPPGEMEFGHLRLDRNGTTVEQRCSGWAVDQRLAEAIKANPNSALARLAKNASAQQARFLPQALEQGDQHALQLLKELADDLAFALSHVVHLAHPQAVVLGGGLARLGAPLLIAVQEGLVKYLMSAFLPGPALRLAALGEDAVPIGAIHLARLAAKTQAG